MWRPKKSEKDMARDLANATRVRKRRIAAALTEFRGGDQQCQIEGGSILTLDRWFPTRDHRWLPGEKYRFAWEAESGLCIAVEVRVVFPKKRRPHA